MQICEAKVRDEGGSRRGSSGKPAIPKSFNKRPKRVDAKEPTKKRLCFKCGNACHIAKAGPEM